MKTKNMKLSTVILVIGLIAAVAACLLTGILRTPTVTEQAFHYSVTYRLNGETKTVAGVYTCRFESQGDDPTERYYTGEYTVNGVTDSSRTHTIAEKDGYELYIVVWLNESYLMADTQNEFYESSLEAPCLEAIDREGMQYGQEELSRWFDAEIVSWEYPEPIENTFVFSGFSLLHTGSMLAMLGVGFLVILACMIFVKRDKTVAPKAIDRLSLLLNFAIVIVAIPFVTMVVGLLQITMSSDELAYQILLCLPAFTAFTVAASIAWRRSGFKKLSVAVQLVGPAFFFLYYAVESVLYNLIY